MSTLSSVKLSQVKTLDGINESFSNDFNASKYTLELFITASLFQIYKIF